MFALTEVITNGGEFQEMRSVIVNAETFDIAKAKVYEYCKPTVDEVDRDNDVGFSYLIQSEATDVWVAGVMLNESPKEL